MPIVFEEMSGEVVPDPRPEERGEREGEAGPSPLELEARVRAVLALEARRALRLSDR